MNRYTYTEKFINTKPRPFIDKKITDLPKFENKIKYHVRTDGNIIDFIIGDQLFEKTLAVSGTRFHTPRGNATLIGLSNYSSNRINIWFHIDGEPGASFWEKISHHSQFKENKVYILYETTNFDDKTLQTFRNAKLKSYLIPEGVLSTYSNMVNSSEYSDLTIYVGKEHKFYAHRCILMNTPFTKFFKNCEKYPGENNNLNEIRFVGDEFSRETFEDVLRYIYTGRVLINSDNCLSILQTAQFLCMDELFDECVEAHFELLTVDNLSYWSDFAIQNADDKRFDIIVTNCSKFSIEKNIISFLQNE